jgi:pyrroloquinoline-quinone synthase
MTQMDDISVFLGKISRGLSERLRAHPFLAKCRNGQVKEESLRRFLGQHGLYSSYFTRYLCALMANLPNGDDVRALAENLFDELGLSPDSPIAHATLFQNMLDDFGVSRDAHGMTAGTRGLIDTMMAHCRHPDPAVGLGALCLGAEALVPDFYSDLILGFEAHGAAPERLAFFHLHVACDDAHAATLMTLMKAQMARDPSCRSTIARAGETLVRARHAFFDDIEKSVEYAA